MPKFPKHADLGIVAVLAIGLIVAVTGGGVVERWSPPERPSRSPSPPGEVDENPVAAPDSWNSQPIDRTVRVAQNDSQSRPGNVPPAHVPGQMLLGPGAPLGGKRPFSAHDPWNAIIADWPVDPASDLLIESIGKSAPLHPDFGAGEWNGAPIGIPYIVVDGTQPPVRIRYAAYGDESDPGPFPIPPNAPIEGAPNTDGDRHVIVIDRDGGKIYELFRAFRLADGQVWQADSGAVFDFRINTRRPAGWTSADAAGLPIFPGLVRYEEVVEIGEINHALRFTVERTRRAYVPPASHFASSRDDANLPPMGMRVRLKASVDLSTYPPEARVILTALQQYGMILADNGSNWFLSGSPDPRWNDDALRSLRKIKGSDFEVLRMTGLTE